jgi:hypothetical protein
VFRAFGDTDDVTFQAFLVVCMFFVLFECLTIDALGRKSGGVEKHSKKELEIEIHGDSSIICICIPLLYTMHHSNSHSTTSSFCSLNTMLLC